MKTSMYQRIKTELNKALSVYTLVGLMLVIILFKLTYGSMVWAYENIWLEDQDFFVYNSVIPFKNTFTTNEFPRFVTDAVYYKNMDVRWEDKLWCKENGYLSKYPVQYYPKGGVWERKEAGFDTLNSKKGEIPTWAYQEVTFMPDTTACMLEWEVIGRSLHGREIQYQGTTVWFDVVPPN